MWGEFFKYQSGITMVKMFWKRDIVVAVGNRSQLKRKELNYCSDCLWKPSRRGNSPFPFCPHYCKELLTIKKIANDIRPS